MMIIWDWVLRKRKTNVDLNKIDLFLYITSSYGIRFSFYFSELYLALMVHCRKVTWCSIKSSPASLSSQNFKISNVAYYFSTFVISQDSLLRAHLHAPPITMFQLSQMASYCRVIIIFYSFKCQITENQWYIIKTFIERFFDIWISTSVE